MRHLYLIIFIVFVIWGCSNKQPKGVQQIDIDFIETITKTNSLSIINSIDSILLSNDNTHSRQALLYFKKAKNLSILQKEQKAIDNFKKALVLFTKLESEEYIAETQWHIGSSYAYLSNKTEAVSRLLLAIDLNKKLQNKKLEANINSSLAHVHYLNNDFRQAIEYTKKAINIQKASKDTLGFSATYNNLAVIYKNTEDYDNALKYNNESLKYNILLNDKSSIAKSYNNLGQVYERMNNDRAALRFYNKSMELNRSISSSNTTPIRNIASLYKRKKELDNANLYYLKALKIVQDNTNIQKGIYNNLLGVALQRKDVENAQTFLEKRDSLSSIQNKKSNKETRQVIETQHKLANEKNELNRQVQINKKNKIIFVTIFILLLSITLLAIQHFHNKKLRDEMEKIELEQTVLRSQMNPHFIFNALTAIQNTLLDNEPLKSAGYLSRFAKLIRQNFDFINEKSILLKDELDALQNYIETQKIRYNDKFSYKINIQDDIDINVVEIPPLLLQPFVENAIEHGFENKTNSGELTITITRNKNKLCYEIKDNGKGYDILKKQEKVHSLDIVKKRLKLLGHNDEKSLKIDSNEKGTTILFCIE